MTPILLVFLCAPLAAIAVVVRIHGFHAVTIFLASIAGELVGVLVYLLYGKLWQIGARFFGAPSARLIVYLPPSTSENQIFSVLLLLTPAFLLALAVLVGRWIYVRLAQ